MKHPALPFLIVAVFVCGTDSVLSQTNAEKHKAEVSCPRSEAIDEFRQKVLSTGGTVDSPHVSEGIAVIATVGDHKANVATIQKAATGYLERMKSLRADEGASTCAELSRAISAGKISETMTPFGAGVLFLITSQDKKLQRLIQDSDCCRWCGPCGSHSTAGCCRRC